MKFIAVSRAAAETLASDRFLQACEFLQGLQFAEFVRNPTLPTPELPRVRIHRDPDGVALVARR